MQIANAMIENKVIILVLAGGNESYQELVKVVRSTWGSDLEGVTTLYVYGNPGNIDFKGQKVVQVGDVLYSNCGDGKMDLLEQTISSFEYVLSHFDFTHVFRCNCGSYVNTYNLLEFAKDKPQKQFYSGIEGNHNGIRFASGSGFFLSRDLMQLLVEKKKLLHYEQLEDVEIGMFLATNRVEIYPARRQDIWSLQDTIDLSYYHYYCIRNSPDVSESMGCVRIPMLRAVSPQDGWNS